MNLNQIAKIACSVHVEVCRGGRMNRNNTGAPVANAIACRAQGRRAWRAQYPPAARRAILVPDRRVRRPRATKSPLPQGSSAGAILLDSMSDARAAPRTQQGWPARRIQCSRFAVSLARSYDGPTASDEGFGSCASAGSEPRQARKGAAIRSSRRVPQINRNPSSDAAQASSCPTRFSPASGDRRISRP